MAIEEQKVEEDELDLTPMIDVVFLLLVFFMVATKAKTSNRALDANLPKNMGSSSSKKDEPSENINIEIKESGGRPRIFVNNFPIDTFDGLFQKLRQLTNVMDDAPVIIAPEGRVSFKYVVMTLNACSKAAIEKVSFAQPSKVR